MTDAELLGQFVQERSQAAFAELVRRHVDWVHSSALRRVRDAHLAEDVTQAVFIVLATRAHSLGRQRVLSAWLFHVVAHVSAQVLRREARRRRHETLAAEQMQMTTHQNSDNAMHGEWEQIAHLLEGAVGRLREGDREAVMLRFYEQKSFAEVGIVLGISEEAARKRVSRATDKLRGMLQSKGATTPAVMLGTVLLAEVTKPAPVALAASVVSGSATGAAAIGATATLAKGAIAVMAWTKIKLAASIVLASLLVAGGGAVVALQLKPNDPGPNPAAVVNAPGLDEPWKIAFHSIYNLEEGQIIKRIEPPFIPERQMYYEASSNGGKLPADGRPPRDAPVYFSYNWDDGKIKGFGLGFGRGPLSISGVLQHCFSLNPFEFEGPDEFMRLTVAGDWIIRSEAPMEQKLAVLAPILSEATGRKVTFERKTVLRDVIVVRGEYAFRPHPSARDVNHIQMYVGEYKEVNQDGGGGGTGNFPRLLESLGSQMGLRLFDESEGLKPARLSWYHNQSSYLRRIPTGPERDEAVGKLLDVVAEQTSLKFSKEKRNVAVWQLGLTGG